MRRWLLLWALLCAAAASAQERLPPACPDCRIAAPVAPVVGLDVCEVIDCPIFQSPGPAWTFGRMADPVHGGYASVASDSGAETLVLSCESRGPMALSLRSGRFDRGEAQIVIDEIGIEWLTFENRAGLLFAEIPRASRLVAGLQDGQDVQIVSADGRVVLRFGLRGSARAIDAAMGYCAER